MSFLNATYRIQLSKDFTLRDLEPFIPYLHDLGISHLYLSPVLSSTSGSNHGYDGTDFAIVSEERGGIEALRDIDAKLRTMSPPMKMLLDIVPNHLAASTENKYWVDLLTHGDKSEFWLFFDMRVKQGDKIVLPVLGDSLENLVRSGEIKIAVKNGLPIAAYGDKHFPLQQESIDALGDDPQATTPDALLRLLEDQHYRLAFWRDVPGGSTYRRFFDVSELIGLRVEDENVYRKTHQAIFDLMREMPSIDGVRVDHIDGLVDPGQYLQRLGQDVKHVWVEKILAPDEDMPEEWRIEGTSGYEFIDRLNPVLVDPQGFAAVEDFWRGEIQGEWPSFADAVTQAKGEMLDTLFATELDRLVDFWVRDGFDADDARIFWRGVTIGLPVYRIYSTSHGVGAVDNNRITQAMAKAAALDPAFARIGDRLLPLLLQPQTENQERAVIEWQQLSGPTMAKGLEDTAHYRYTPLAALNEVGTGPELVADGFAVFSDFANRRAAHYPRNLNATSTHDTKRSEDARHRLYALADMPNEWIAFYRAMIDADGPAPDVQYFLLQALLAAWPLDDVIDGVFKKRIKSYMEKALREAKWQTSPAKPDAAYEKQIADFIDKVLDTPETVAKLGVFAGRLSIYGAVNSLAALVLKILSPGVPDIYQGNEGWDFSLVDPDNRRPVDFAGHQSLAARLPDDLATLLPNWRDGGIKIGLTQRLLHIRKNTLGQGGVISMQPLTVGGRHARHIIAYRIAARDAPELVVLALRYPHGVLATDADMPSTDGSSLAFAIDSFEETYANLLTGKRTRIDETVFGGLPIAVLQMKD